MDTLEHTTDLLSEADETLFTEGGCHIFAVCLVEVFRYPLRLLRNITSPHPGGIVHVYCLPANDVMIDFHGRNSERSYLRANGYHSSPYQVDSISLSRIAELSVNEFGRGGLYAEARFVETARRRAFAVIDADKTKYEYVV